MEMCYRNTTNITCKTNLVTRKHTLESRMEEIKTELLKHTSKLVLKKTKDIIKKKITSYRQQTSMLLKNDRFRKNVTAVVGPVFETTQTLSKLATAIKKNRENIALLSHKKPHSDEVLHRQIMLKRKLKQTYLLNNEHCNKDTDNHHHNNHHNSNHHHHHSNHHSNKCNHKKHNNCQKCHDKENYFNDLYNQWAIIKINKYIDDLMKEDYFYLSIKLTSCHLDELIDSLNEFKLTCNIGYIRIVDLYINIVQIIFSNVSLRNSLDSGEPLEKYKYDAKILGHMEKLNTILLSMKVLLEEQKKKYIIYDETYGKPEDGLYIPFLLMEIDKTLFNNSSTSSESDNDCQYDYEYKSEHDQSNSSENDSQYYSENDCEIKEEEPNSSEVDSDTDSESN